MRRFALLLAAIPLMGMLALITSNAPPAARTFCRVVRILRVDSANGLAAVALGPRVLPGADSVINVPPFPNGVLCTAIPDTAAPPPGVKL